MSGVWIEIEIGTVYVDLVLVNSPNPELKTFNCNLYVKFIYRQKLENYR